MNKTPDIEYPCDWTYKIIGLDEDRIRTAVQDVINTRLHTLLESNQSKTGKYVSYTLVVPVDDEQDRNGIYQSLKQHPYLVMVL